MELGRTGLPLGLRHDARDAWLLVATLVQAGLSVWLLWSVRDAEAPWRLLAAGPLAAGIWWNANTIAHIHMHRPLFRSRAFNRGFAACLSLTTLIPQTIWRHRHLWHHTGKPGPAPHLRLNPQLGAEIAIIGAALAGVALVDATALVWTLCPAFAAAMVLCQLQGHHEHHEAGRSLAAGISHYSRWYNWLWFHDGYHIEHHLEPTRHWLALPALRAQAAETLATGVSPLPPVLRWARPAFDASAAWSEALRNHALGALERLAMAWRPLGAAMVSSHRRAFAALFAEVATDIVARPDAVVVIVGGGLFPRTLLALEPLLPRARFRVVDGSADSIDRLRQQLRASPALAARVEVVQAEFAPAEHAAAAALVILPLALRGDPLALARACGCLVVCHRWLFSAPAPWSRRISWLLCKRLDAYGVSPPPSAP